MSSVLFSSSKIVPHLVKLTICISDPVFQEAYLLLECCSLNPGLLDAQLRLLQDGTMSSRPVYPHLSRHTTTIATCQALFELCSSLFIEFHASHPLFFAACVSRGETISSRPVVKLLHTALPTLCKLMRLCLLMVQGLAQLLYVHVELELLVFVFYTCHIALCLPALSRAHWHKAPPHCAARSPAMLFLASRHAARSEAAAAAPSAEARGPCILAVAASCTQGRLETARRPAQVSLGPPRGCGQARWRRRACQGRARSQQAGVGEAGSAEGERAERRAAPGDPESVRWMYSRKY